jgi:hypothetical protein
MICGSLEVVEQIMPHWHIVEEKGQRGEKCDDWLHAYKKCSENASFYQKCVLVANVEYIVAIEFIELLLAKQL